MQRTFGTLVLIAAMLLTFGLGRAGETRRVTFVVHCYDVGVHALSNEPGVIAVERGWKGFDEVNRVTYDPERTSLEAMEKRLRNHDTYVETVEEERE